jgi:hypothetical protein
MVAARRQIGETRRIVNAECGELDPSAVTMLAAMTVYWLQRGSCPGHVCAAPINLPRRHRTERDRRE